MLSEVEASPAAYEMQKTKYHRWSIRVGNRMGFSVVVGENSNNNKSRFMFVAAGVLSCSQRNTKNELLLLEFSPAANEMQKTKYYGWSLLP